ncbi:CsiV family protein [Pseudoalteromonas piscicida]|uniref:CsiV family protein n=1 Tax=Pseudoalteromonas piscicida TaxID=43662 RepID=UPI003098827C
MKIIKSMAILAALASSYSAHATRWFEVELIAFEQAPSYSLKEDFSIEPDPLQRRNIKPLLIEGFNTTGYKLCLSGSEQFKEQDFIRALTQGAASNICDPDANYIEKFASLPLSPQVEPQEHMDSIYLLDSTQLNFTDKVAGLKRKGLKPILHTGWRFPEQSKRRAPNIEIVAGEQFSAPSSYRIVDTRDEFSSLSQGFDVEASKGQTHWQLEGLIKIHVRHYLYVTTELDLMYEDGNDTRTARMSQYTRVYSGDIHYLDHPKLGVIFQIRKYKH